MKRPASLAHREEWATRRERGAVPLIRIMVWITLRLGRTAARVILVPVCAWFFVCAPRARRASRGWLTRVLGRPATLFDIWRHFWCFAVCLLDGVLLLNDRMDLFAVEVQGHETVTGVRARHGGAFLFGAHLGSFEALRATGRAVGETGISLAMYEDNARKTNQVLNAINPSLAIDIIGLGRAGSMLAVRERLEEGHFVGVLADRGLDSERCISIPLFGEPARFPVGPFRLAAILKRPIVFMVGLYRGGNRYEIHFEMIDELDQTAGRTGDQAIEETMRRYVATLERYCRSAPYNCFNFYEFWN